MNTITYPSGREIYLDQIPRGALLREGEMNLFLIKIEPNNLQGHREFLGTLQRGDGFIPCPTLSCKEGQYHLALVPIGQVKAEEVEPAEIRESWDSLLRRLICASIGEATDASNESASLEAFVKWTQQKRIEKLKQEQRNATVVSASLGGKIASLGSVAGFASPQKGEPNLLAGALKQISEFYQLPFDAELLTDDIASPAERMKDFAAKSRWRYREVELSGDYYKQTATPLLAFVGSDHVPVVLYLSSSKSFYVKGGGGGEKVLLTAANASDVASQAFCFYEQLPPHCQSWRGLLPFIFRHSRGILIMMIVMGLLSSLISLVMPMATRYITETLIPTANTAELWQLLALLLVLTTSSIAAKVVPSLLMLLFGTQQYERFQAAIFDLVLRIPVNVFKTCDTGDMTSRILGAHEIQSIFFNTITQQLTSLLFSIGSLVMMFYYSVTLGFIGLGMVVIYASVFFLLSKINLKPLAAQIASAGRLNGFTQQLFNGISKVRAAGAEERLISRFFDDYSQQQKQGYIIARNGAIQSSFTTIFPMVISVLFYAIAGGMWSDSLSLPIFLAFMAAFQGFQSALLEVSGGIWTLLAVKPEVERLNLILKQTPEDNEQRRFPGKLDGRIEVSHLNFRYQSDGPLVLNDLSLSVAPGEFVAIVGPSGAGKSSLIRLLLGFEHCESGGISYSGQDINTLDLRGVRLQLGVILQNGKILPGSILDNIITGTTFTVQDAWAALKAASFDEEVKAMPMDIHTLVTPETISGGQQQRLLLARALVGNPSIVILDESTSALDNIAQENVRSNLERMRNTRIVIAHRLSTIAKADRIYVLDRGRIVQEGTYAELSAHPGLFRTLIQRQLTNPEADL